MSERKVKLSKENQTFVLDQKQQECTAIIDSEKLFTYNETRCPTVWDKVACWPSTLAGQTAHQKCPDYIDSFLYNANATKHCNQDGTWFVHPTLKIRWTNYTNCVNKLIDMETLPFSQDHVHILRYISLVGYSVSLVALIIAIFIMMSFKKLRCARNTLHLNLFASFVWRAVVSLSKSFLLVDGTPLLESVVFASLMSNDSSWQCRLFSVIFNFGMISNYSWIFVEGMYLHTLIFVAFFSETSGVYGFVLFGWVFPIVCLLSWAAVRATLENAGCWIIHSTKWSAWIIKGPLLVTVLLNFFFFINIVRVLFTKLQSANNLDSRRHRHMKLAKSSLVLIPLFGVPYMVFLALDEKFCPALELPKLYFEMIFNSFNGFIVALLYCFLNGEVKAELAKKWRKANLSLTSRGISHRKSTLTRSINSNVHGVVLSNTFDTTALQDETVEDFIKNGSKETRLMTKKSNHLEMKNVSRIQQKNQTKRASEDDLEYSNQAQKFDETESAKGEDGVQDEDVEKEEIEDEKEFHQLLQTPVTDNKERNLAGNKTGLNSNRGSRCSKEEDDEHDDGKSSVYLEMEKRCMLQTEHNNNNDNFSDYPKSSFA